MPADRLQKSGPLNVEALLRQQSLLLWLAGKQSLFREFAGKQDS